CLGDGIRQLSGLSAARWPRPRAWAVAANVGALLFVAWTLARPLHRYSDEVALAYRSGVPLDLPGSSRLRLSPGQVGQLAALTDSLRRRCRTFLTLPGLNSLYQFTQRPPPVELSGPWMYFFDSQDQ